MSSQLGPATAGDPADKGAAGKLAEAAVAGVGSAFALPAKTSFRFALLIGAVVTSSFIAYEGIYLATPRGPALISLVLRCRAQALAQRPSTIGAYAAALQRANACYSTAARTEAWWGLLGIGVLVAVAGVIFLAQPWWYRRRRRLADLGGDGAAELITRLEVLRGKANTGPVIWLLQPLNVRLSAFAFGHPGRRCVAISGGAAVAAIRKPAAFDAVILHELAHLRNRDIDQTYLALAIWRAFVISALVPMAVLLIFTSALDAPQRLIWRVAALALIVYLLRNSILRSREFDADARVKELDPETALGAVLAAAPARAGRRARLLGWTHPSGPRRAGAMLDPAPLYKCRFWDGLAVGLVAAIGASALREIVTLQTTTLGIRLLVPAVVFGAFAGAALAVAMWRNQLFGTGLRPVEGWAAGLGLGLGLMLGPIINLQAAAGLSLAPDHLDPAAFGVLAVWLCLGVLVFTPLPVWVGQWAEAWQHRASVTGPRVAARGGMIVAAVGAWLVMAIGLYLLEQTVTWLLAGSDPATVWHQLPELLRDTGFVVTAQGGGELGGWVVCAVVVLIPFAAAAVQRRRQQQPDGLHSAATGSGRRIGTAALVVVGCLAAAALTLAISAVTHARIAEQVRWNPDFLVRLVSFDQQGIIVVALACALVAAARARSARGAAASVLAGAAVAAAGGLALSNIGTIDHCFTALSIQYAHPPSGNCIAGPNSGWIRQTILGAALVSILFVPAAYAAGSFASRRFRRERLATVVRALGWMAAAAGVVAAITGTALWGPRASAHGIGTAGSIGRDGWIQGYGYEVRLSPNWFAVAQTRNPGQVVFTFPVDRATIDLVSYSSISPVKITDYKALLVRLGAHTVRLDRAPGLRLARRGLPDAILEQWFIVRGQAVYMITLYKSPYGGIYLQDSPYLEESLARILATWHWQSFVTPAAKVTLLGRAAQRARLAA